ncbi:MAG: hypothetical protein ACTSVU_05755 [Promethearchaeota archaeon]
MRKVVIVIIALLVSFTCLALGLTAAQQTLIAPYFREMHGAGLFVFKALKFLI